MRALLGRARNRAHCHCPRPALWPAACSTSGSGFAQHESRARRRWSSSAAPVEAKVLALSEAVGTSAEQLGYWPVDIAMRAIEQVHMVSGMPYWTSIVAVTVATRLTLAPLMVWQSRMVARLQAAKPEVEEVQARMKAIPKLSTEQLMGFRDEMNAIWAKHEVTPLAPFKVLPLTMILGISTFWGCERMHTHFPGWTSGGDLWFVDLSAGDPTYALPMLTGATLLLVGEVSPAGTGDQAAKMKMFLRVMAAVSVPLSALLSNGALVYLVTQNVFSAIQGVAFSIPSVRQTLGMPPQPVPPADKK